MKALSLFSLLKQYPMMYYVSLFMFVRERNCYIYRKTKVRCTFTLPINIKDGNRHKYSHAHRQLTPKARIHAHESARRHGCRYIPKSDGYRSIHPQTSSKNNNPSLYIHVLKSLGSKNPQLPPTPTCCAAARLALYSAHRTHTTSYAFASGGPSAPHPTLHAASYLRTLPLLEPHVA